MYPDIISYWYLQHICKEFPHYLSSLGKKLHWKKIKSYVPYLCYLYFFLHDRPWISPWIKSIFKVLRYHYSRDRVTIGHREVISIRLWRHQQNENRASETRGWCVKIVVFVVIFGFVMSCKKWYNVRTLVTNCFCAHSSVILVFISVVTSQL